MITFENVGLRYGMGQEILRDLSFKIPPQSFQFLTGPSGAGKTTLLKLILFTLKPTRGLITLFGRDAAALDKDAITNLRRRIGVVFQDFRLLNHLTTYENVALPLRVQGREEASYRNEVIELLGWVGLGERMHALPAVLSGGEKQRAAIARALIVRPELLLADEPTGGGGGGGQRRPDAGAAPAAALHGAPQIGYIGRHRDARPRAHGPVRRRPPPGARRQPPAHFRVRRMPWSP